MISDTPIVEIGILCDGSGREYAITGYNGRFDWQLIQQFEEELEESPKEIETIMSGIEIDHGIVTIIAQLSKVEPEIQYGTGYGDILTIPGYYDVKSAELIFIHHMERETQNECVDF